MLLSRFSRGVATHLGDITTGDILDTKAYHTYSLTNINPGEIGPIRNSLAPCTWPEFCLQYQDSVQQQPKSKPKAQLLGLCAATFDNNHRSGINFKQITILPLDFDQVPKGFDISATLKQSGYNYLLIESPSSAWNRRKYRLYVPFQAPITNGKLYSLCYMDSVEAIHPTLTPLVDKQCKDTARFMYIPNASRLPSISTNTTGTNLPCPDPDHILGQESPKPDQNHIVDPQDLLIGQKWALPTFDLTLNTAPPGVPKRPTSDSGHHLVTEGGIKDFNHPTAPNRYEYTSWSELHAIFSAIHRGKLLPTSVHPYYLNKWESAGRKLLTDNDISPLVVKIVEDGTKARYHAVMKGGSSDLLPLDPAKNEFDVILEMVKDPDIPTLAVYEDIMYRTKPEDGGEWKNLPPSRIKKNIRAISSSKKLILGAKSTGLYYSPSQNCICEALHGTRTFAPIQHPIIETYLSSLPFKHDWLLDYLHYLPQVKEHALPWIHTFGPSQAGKTLFAELCASLWDRPPVTGLFMSNFQSGMGSSPIILMDEEIPNSPQKSISVLNACKILVTSKENEANKKYEIPLSVQGYHRLFSTENSDEPTALNIPDFLHLGALTRRCLVVQFTDEQKDFLLQNTATEISSWLQSKFGEHLTYLRQSRRPRDPQGLIAVQPYETEFLSETNPTGELPRGVMETVIAVLNGQDKDGGYYGENREEYFLNFNSGGFQDKLISRRVVVKSKSAKYLKSMIMRCVDGSKYERTTVGGDRQRVISLPFVALSDLADNLGLELRLTEKRKLEEKEKIKNK